MSGNWDPVLREPRLGVMLHYDGSASDAGALAWLTQDPRCRVSYNWLVRDQGLVVPIAPDGARAWHAGRCRSSDPERLPYRDANSAFWGVAIAARPGDRATEAQLAAVIRLCREILKTQGWQGETWRIVGHDTECWPRGRKIDPTGPDPSHPVLSVALVRREVG